MNEIHRKILNNDLREVFNLGARLFIKIKLFYYFFQRPLIDFFLRKFLKKSLADNYIFSQIDKFLLNEGGMFKEYVYKICNNFSSLKDSTILVPGVGYGRNLFQLAAFKPKIIVAFDIYDYQEEWDFLSQKILKEFRVKVLFFKGDFNSLPKNYSIFFDFIISDAVLEHIKNFLRFAENSKKFLKNGGIFYASFGPIWYGPGGDHINWGENGIFNHLILSGKEYSRQFDEKFKAIKQDSCEGEFLVKENIFSRLKTGEYLEILSKYGFSQKLLFVKILTRAIFLFKRKPEIYKLLDEKNLPKFDRLCGGIYLWSKIQKD